MDPAPLARILDELDWFRPTIDGAEAIEVTNEGHRTLRDHLHREHPGAATVQVDLPEVASDV